MMTITFLGTGTSQGVPIIGCNCKVCSSTDSRDKRLRTSALIDINGEKIVIDAGPDFRQQMLSHKICNIRAILITHEHIDHIGGLDDVRALNYINKKPTEIYAEKRVQNALHKVFYYAFGENKYPGTPEFDLHTIDENKFLIDDIEIVPIRGLHYKLPVLGFRIGKLCYITDMNKIFPEEMEKLKNLDVFVINALRENKHISHFCLQQALDLIAEIKPKKTYITHISHQFATHVEIEKKLPENVYPAFDGLSVEID